MRPLDGITVVDLTRVLSGPYCTMVLADLGARVIKIERPGTGDDTRGWGPPFLDGESAYFMSINRNKESVTIDFKRDEGGALLTSLVARADVLVENFRPGTLDSIGFGYDTVAAAYPRLVYASVSGFGQTGPRRDEAGYDAIAQAEGGLMSITGPADGSPYRLGVPIVDIAAGIFAAQGITAALLARERTGRGQRVDVALLDSAAALLTYQAGNYFASGEPPVRLGNRHQSIVPYDTFTASDGDFVLAVGTDDLWRRFCEVATLPDEPRFATNRQRVGAYTTLRPLIAARMTTRTRGDWMERLKHAGIPCGLVRDIGELFRDPQMAARDMVVELAHPVAGAVQTVGTPMKLSDTPAELRTAPPTLGQHTNAVLERDLGLTPAAIADLRTRGVV